MNIPWCSYLDKSAMLLEGLPIRAVEDIDEILERSTTKGLLSTEA